jgi:plastocyanin
VKKSSIALALLMSSFVIRAETFRMVQADKTFLGNITEKQALEVFDNPEIEEKHKVDELKAKVGDSITFMNRDEVAHNVSGHINTDNQFDVKIQEPGAKNDRTILLSKKGEYTIECAIHPKMKFKVKVD